MKKKALLLTFCLLIANFFVIAYLMFNPGGRGLFLPSIIIFFLLGAALIFLTLKQKIKGALKKFLILTGASAAGFFISAFLHNTIYVIFMHLFKLEVKHEALFFIAAVIICPIVFLIGAIGSIILLFETKGVKSETGSNTKEKSRKTKIRNSPAGRSQVKSKKLKVKREKPKAKNAKK